MRLLPSGCEIYATQIGSIDRYGLVRRGERESRVAGSDRIRPVGQTRESVSARAVGSRRGTCSTTKRHRSPASTGYRPGEAERLATLRRSREIHSCDVRPVYGRILACRRKGVACPARSDRISSVAQSRKCVIAGAVRGCRGTSCSTQSDRRSAAPGSGTHRSGYAERLRRRCCLSRRPGNKA